MSLSRRIATLFRAKANKALDRAEDPREMLDYSYERQLELLQQVRRGVADVATSRRRVELQLAQLQQSAAKLQGQAQQALAAGREDLAREALTRRAAVTSQIGDLPGAPKVYRRSKPGPRSEPSVFPWRQVAAAVSWHKRPNVLPGRASGLRGPGWLPDSLISDGWLRPAASSPDGVVPLRTG